MIFKSLKAPFFKKGALNGFFVSLCLLSLVFPFTTHALQIVSLKPNITQSLIWLGAKDQIVGITQFCKKPNSKAQVVADYQSLNLEALLQLESDYILLSPENSQKKQFATLEQSLKSTQTKIVILDFSSLSHFFEAALALANLVNQSTKALNHIEHFKAKIAQNKTHYAKFKDATFAVVVQREPLMVASGNTFISELLSQSGLKNVFFNNKIAYPTLNAEDLLLKKPDFIFEMSHEEGLSQPYLGLTVTRLPIDDFLPQPQSLDAALALFDRL